MLNSNLTKFFLPVVLIVFLFSFNTVRADNPCDQCARAEAEMLSSCQGNDATCASVAQQQKENCLAECAREGGTLPSSGAVYGPEASLGGVSGAVQHLNWAGKDTYGQTPASLVTLVGQIIQIVLGLLGVIFLTLTFYGGYIWMIARGDEKEVERASGIIKMAVIGLIIILLAYSISYFIFARLVNVSGASV